MTCNAERDKTCCRSCTEGLDQFADNKGRLDGTPLLRGFEYLAYGSGLTELPAWWGNALEPVTRQEDGRVFFY